MIGDDDAARIDMHGGQAEVFEGERDDEAGEALAVARNGVDGAWRELAEDGDAFDKLSHFLEMIVERAVELGAMGQRDDLTGFAGVEVAEIVELANVVFALAVDGGLGDGEELVGGLAHRGNHDDRMLFGARFHNGGDALDGSSGFDRSAAEFHDDHDKQPL